MDIYQVSNSRQVSDFDDEHKFIEHAILRALDVIPSREKAFNTVTPHSVYNESMDLEGDSSGVDLLHFIFILMTKCADSPTRRAADAQINNLGRPPSAQRSAFVPTRLEEYKQDIDIAISEITPDNGLGAGQTVSLAARKVMTSSQSCHISEAKCQFNPTTSCE